MAFEGGKRSRRALAALLALALLGLLALPGGGASAGAEPNATASKVKQVSISGFAFKPQTLRVRKGARVRFKNRDGTVHTATRRGSFDTGRLRKGQSQTIRFKRRGTFRYLCVIHPFMRGKIVVK